MADSACDHSLARASLSRGPLIRHNLHVFNGFHPRGVALTGTVLQMQLHLGGRGRKPVGYFSIVNSYQLIL